jgi:hypothetical protein
MSDLDTKTLARMRPEDLAELEAFAAARDISLGDALALVIKQIEAESKRQSKLVGETNSRRVYVTADGTAVSCSLQHQRTYDPDDGQAAGWYGWCGPVEDQSDYVIGPYDSGAAVFAAYEKRHKKHRRVAGVKLHRAYIGPDNRFHGVGPEFIELPSN